MKRMSKLFGNPLLGIALVALLPGSLTAQEPATISGKVTTKEGQTIPAVSIAIQGMNLLTLTDVEGKYQIFVPASRVSGQEIKIRASIIGRKTETKTLTLTSGAHTVDFQLAEDPLRLQEIVVTGAGTTHTRQKLGVTINTVRSEEILRSQESNIIAALAGKAPNVEVTSSSGDPGAGAYIRIRGLNSLVGDGQPLIVVDGVPINNSSYSTEGNHAGTVESNRAADLNTRDIEDVQILKGPAASAIYGSRAANGVILITTRSGKPGRSNISYFQGLSVGEVNASVPLQMSFGQGARDVPEIFGGTEDICLAVVGLPKNRCVFTWGARIPAGTEVFDHAWEIFETSYQLEEAATLSGGTDRTTYYLSLSRLDNDGHIVGVQQFERTTVRLKASHAFRDDLRVGASLSFAGSQGDLVQQGSNISGLLLGALRTPPDFNNMPYLNAAGLHRSYRTPDPTGIGGSRGYDNPFWIANEITNDADVGRTFGNMSIKYDPTPWLTLNYTLGADYSADERRTVFPKMSSDFPDGRVVRADLIAFELDHNLSLAANRTFSDEVIGTLTVGQNLNHREFRLYEVRGQNLIYTTDQLDYTVDRIPNEYTSTIRTDGYFAQGTLDLFHELYITAGIRLDGSSTFGGEDKRFFYPKVSGGWEVTEYMRDWFMGGSGLLTFGKLRFGYGVAGKQPYAYSNTTGYVTGTITDGWVSPNGLETIYGGLEGVVSPGVQGNPNIEPEQTSETEVGADLAFWNSRLALSVTYYNQRTTDAILAVDQPPSTGYGGRFENAGEFENWGWEATADLKVVDRSGFQWNLGALWAQNESCVRDLAGAESFGLAGFTSAQVSVIAPERDANGNITKCHPFGVLYGDDFMRFGRGSVNEDGASIDETYPGWNPGDLYIGPDGFPRVDPQLRVVGNPNPHWTGSVRNTFTISDNLQISGLVDIRYGGDVWNGTRGALYYFGTHEGTEEHHGDGQMEVFGSTILEDEGAWGPGAGKDVNINWWTWYVGGLGSGFTGPTSQFIEDGGFVKLRDISLSYTWSGADWMERLGFSSAVLTASGRNLRTWTAYTGVDPETNLWGQTPGRGIDYFTNPQTRSFVFHVTLNR